MITKELLRRTIENIDYMLEQETSREVAMYDLDMNELARFSDLAEAEDETGIDRRLISKCCLGDSKSTHKHVFQWLYYEK